MGSPNIGIYSLATDGYAILPARITNRKTAGIEKALNVKVVNLDLAYSKLIGVLAVANSEGIALPHYVSEEEVRFLIKSLGVKVKRVESDKTCFGNLVLTTDRGAVASPILRKTELEALRQTLDVEVVKGTIAGLSYVGSLASATNKGVLTHPGISEDEKETLSSVLRVPVVPSTVNGGSSYVSSGILVNSFGAVVGPGTTGPELMIISNLLS